jgi:hypothetical protein
VYRILGWKLIYGLNLAGGTPEEAAEEAAYVSRAIGSHLLAFQIGNEPDGFGRWMPRSTKTYDAAAFIAEWRTFHNAVRARVRDAPFAGPDVATATDESLLTSKSARSDVAPTLSSDNWSRADPAGR